jgi:hypothetical protein
VHIERVHNYLFAPIPEVLADDGRPPWCLRSFLGPPVLALDGGGAEATEEYSDRPVWESRGSSGFRGVLHPTEICSCFVMAERKARSDSNIRRPASIVGCKTSKWNLVLRIGGLSTGFRLRLAKWDILIRDAE